MTVNEKRRIHTSANGAGALSVAGAVPGLLRFRDRNRGKQVIYTVTPALSEGFESRAAPILDVRPLNARFSLDDEGFELWQHETAVTDFLDDDAMRKDYYPEVDRLVKAATGASRVVIFDYSVRVENESVSDRQALRGPVRVVHNDYTERSGLRRVHDLPDPAHAEEILRHRFAIVNVWRSAGGPIETTPIALTDARSVALEDFVATDFVRPDRTGENYQVAYSPAQRWCYFPRMRRDEALLLKCYDSSSGYARFTAHGAFDDPTAADTARPRECIEVRTLVSFVR